jgi:hypothetical protein
MMIGEETDLDRHGRSPDVANVPQGHQTKSGSGTYRMVVIDESSNHMSMNDRRMRRSRCERGHRRTAPLCLHQVSMTLRA